MSLYNIRSSDDHFIITKFDDDLNVESSYEYHVGAVEDICHCPAGQRPSCRHRQMFPMLQTRVDTAWFLDFDTRAWVDPTGEARRVEQGSPTGADAMAYGAASAASSSISDFNHSIKQDIEEGVQATIRQEPLPSVDSHPFRRRM